MTACKFHRIVLSYTEQPRPAEDVVAGPWCYLGEMWADSWFEFSCEPDPFDSDEAVACVAKECLCKAEELLPDLARILNDKNGTAHSLRFWRAMIMPWLISLLHVVSERHARAKSLVSRYGANQMVIRLTDSDIDWNFEDTSAFVSDGIVTEAFNTWLLSILLRDLVPSSWKIVHQPITPRVAHNLPKLTRKHRFKRAIQGRRCRFVYGLGTAHDSIGGTLGGLIASWLISGVLTLKRGSTLSAPTWDTSSTRAITWPNSLGQIINSTLPKAFCNLAAWTPRRPVTRRGKLNIFCSPMWDEFEKYELASRVEGGELALSAQHGGNYGNSRSFGLVSGVEYRLDGFVSWGWQQQGDLCVRAIPLPSPYLTQLSARRRASSKEIVLVTTLMRAYFYRADSMPQPGVLSRQARSVLSFVEKLGEEQTADLVFRPYPRCDFAFDLRPVFKKRFPNLSFCEDRLHERLLAARAIVLNHPGTTLNLALAANIPVICFWSDQEWAMCDDAQPFFDGLRQVGILHDNGSSAAAFFNDLDGDIEGWWFSSKTQMARNKWRNTYALTSGNWLYTWMMRLWML